MLLLRAAFHVFEYSEQLSDSPSLFNIHVLSNLVCSCFTECVVTYRHHLALRRHEGGPVAEPQLGLEGVEVNLQLALLLDLGRFVEAAVVSEVLELLLHGLHGVLRHTVLQPRDGTADPLQQLLCVCVAKD